MDEKRKVFCEQLEVKQKIKLSEAAIYGIQGTTKTKLQHSDEYEKMMEQADKKIAEAYHDYGKAAVNASTVIARKNNSIEDIER